MSFRVKSLERQISGQFHASQQKIASLKTSWLNTNDKHSIFIPCLPIGFFGGAVL